MYDKLQFDKIIEIERGTDNSYHSFDYNKEVGNFSVENLLRVVKILSLRDDSEEIIDYLYSIQNNQDIVESIKNKMLIIEKNKKKNELNLEELKNKNTIDGKKISKQIYDELKEEIENMDDKPNLKIILVGNDKSSLSYVKQKEKWAKYIGIEYEMLHLSEDIGEIELLEEINRLNSDDTTDGFMIQLPLPKHINKQKVLNSIDPSKDVDGFHYYNQGKILQLDKSGLMPCTAAGVIELLSYTNIGVEGKIVTVLGKSDIAGFPISTMLSKLGATVINCDSSTPDDFKYSMIKQSDIVISATGVVGLITSKHIKQDSVIIDVGITVVDGKIKGDADFDSIIKTGAKITPVPGGVGPMTVAMLMKNTVKAYKIKNFDKINK